jgi:hypothetical protein
MLICSERASAGQQPLDRAPGTALHLVVKARRARKNRRRRAEKIRVPLT